METFDIEDYTILINNSGEVKVVSRENEDEAFSIDLTEENVLITKESGQEFGIIGVGDEGIQPVSNTGLQNNTTGLNTSFEIINIGGSSGEKIDLDGYRGYIKLDGSLLYFSKTSTSA